MNPLKEIRQTLIRTELKRKYKSRIIIGKDFRVRRRFTCLIRDAKLEIGDHVSFNNDCSITVLGSVSIGSETIFGENVRIYDHNHSFKKNDGLIRTQLMSIGKVSIGNNCWIGSNVTILKGAQIGDGCVIGAGCVINGYIPAGSIVRNKQELDIEPIK